MTTLKDIAESVGVSIGTVDRIIHNRGRYSEKTAEKVRKIMTDLNYIPNIHARGLKQTKKHRLYGCAHARSWNNDNKGGD